MSERITRKNVENVFGYFLSESGYRRATSYKDVGGYRLDYAGIYGGYRIERIGNEQGGISTPFGNRRYSTRELYQMLHFCRDYLRTLQEDHKLVEWWKDEVKPS